MTYTILTLTAAYALVVALLAYLLILSRLHWVFKLVSTVATVALIPLTFHGIGELRGLPTDGPMPPSFRMLWAQVIEPNPLKGESGHIFLWLQTLDADNFPVGQPRAWQLPYSDDLQIKVQEAMAKIGEGQDIQGKIDSHAIEEGSTAEQLAKQIQTGARENRAGGSASVGERIYQFEASMLTFTEEAAPVTPTKPP